MRKILLNFQVVAMIVVNSKDIYDSSASTKRILDIPSVPIGPNSKQ